MVTGKKMNRIENIITDKLYSKLKFLDEREKSVFVEYIRSFSFLFYEDIKLVLEIGAGHSTLIFASLAKKMGCKVKTIDMNPEAIIKKVHDQALADEIFDNVDFVRGASVSCDELTSYFDGTISKIGNVNIEDVIDNVDSFIDLEMDNRKEGKVKEALGIANLNSESLKENLLNNEKFAKELIQIYRTDADEFNYCSKNSGNKGVLSDLLDGESVDAVFLDSGEFVSLVEWEIVAKKLRKGGYVFLHDIYFPKSFKNWLVCASIAADPEWEILYQDKSTPQGMMLAKKLA